MDMLTPTSILLDQVSDGYLVAYDYAVVEF